MKILLDSTVLVDLLRANLEVRTRLDQLRGEGAEFYTSTLNLYEARCGLSISHHSSAKQAAALAGVQSELDVLPFDEESARHAAVIYGQLRSIGKCADGLDHLIAGTIVSNGIDAVLTRNKKHFENIREIKQVLTY
ncbi:tRNA(fMet)-specific endonuclease VapC [uncultured archaeon]|nr:tRNA(fMet)-specific endonuclease VapC [uncultured archaeon]